MSGLVSAMGPRYWFPARVNGIDRTRRCSGSSRNGRATFLFGDCCTERLETIISRLNRSHSACNFFVLTGAGWPSGAGIVTRMSESDPLCLVAFWYLYLSARCEMCLSYFNVSRIRNPFVGLSSVLMFLSFDALSRWCSGFWYYWGLVGVWQEFKYVLCNGSKGN